jgi:type II secretory pathway pseudopilin PulG
MTLVEFLLVVFVIAVLAALLLPVSFPRGHAPKIARAKVEMASLAAAIEAYESEYQHLPFADLATNEDVTCGIGSADISDFKKVDGTRLIATNSDLIIVLMDFNLGVNSGHKLNPKQIQFLNAHMVVDTNSPGVSAVDHQYRDSWGNPYIISLDANQDGFVRDAFYANSVLFKNQVPTPLTNNSGVYEYHGKVMIWSRGSDGKASMSVDANSGVNKDNVASWQ